MNYPYAYVLSMLILNMADVPAQAAVVLDQSNLAGPSGTALLSVIGGTSNSKTTQIFTAGQTGKLVRVDLQVLGTDLAFSFLPNSTLPLTDPANSIIFSSVGSGFSVASLDLSAFDFQVVTGQQYGLFLRTLTGTGGWVLGADTDGNTSTTGDRVFLDYAGGAANRFQNGSTSWLETGADRGFATWVDVAAVPEPQTWIMMVLGFGLAGSAFRQNRSIFRLA